MKLLSVYAGKIEEVMHNDRPVPTAIFKKPVYGPVKVTQLGLAVDKQADLRYHGGIERAVYGYPSEHYAYWKMARPDLEFPPALFGENLSTQGMDEAEVSIADAFKIGTAVLSVTGIRVPCFKLGIKAGDPLIIKQFLEANRPGIYFKVLQEGVIEEGGAIERIDSDGYGFTINEMARAYHSHKMDRALVEKAANAPGLSQSWRDHFSEQLARL